MRCTLNSLFCFDIFPPLSSPSPTQVEAPVASHLDVILYSRDQINLENAAMQQPSETYVRESDGAVVAEDAAWGIISIKPQMEAVETPVCMRARTRAL